jgi:predicted DsbA family dithiol-disulfide isomerase
MIKLDILSDPICPWCYIGKTNLDAALAAQPDHPFAIEWHPFQLNPNMPPEGVDRRTYLETKFGGKDGAISVYGQIDRAARAVGLTINFEGIQHTPNTFNAHRLIHWAGIEGRQSLVVATLFKAYFQDGRDIGDTDVLCELAQIAGMDAAMTQRLLDSDTDAADLRAREEHSRKMGVSAVPTFIVANQAVVPGAQKPDFWTDVIADIRADQDTD